MPPPPPEAGALDALSAAHAARRHVDKVWGVSELKWRSHRAMASVCAAPALQNENLDSNHPLDAAQGQPLESEHACLGGLGAPCFGATASSVAALQAMGDAIVTDRLLRLQGQQARSPLRAGLDTHRPTESLTDPPTR